jgi:vitamin K-dependent gamma-carboxylase
VFGRLKSTWASLLKWSGGLSQGTVDSASLIVFRVAFGLVAAWWALDYIRLGRAQAMYVTPRFHFSYWLFSWVQPWPDIGPVLHIGALGLLGLIIAFGRAYRWATLLFAVGFTIFFLWERTNYQNHYYLLTLLSWWMWLLPLGRQTAGRSPEGDTITVEPATVPAWCLWIVRFHVGIPYFYGGLAKFDPDWLTGLPMRDYLVTKTWVPLIGPWLGTAEAGLVFAWGGLLFDLSVVPLLLWKPTRWIGYLAACSFHLTNHFLFSIHIFPWFMIAATTLFFEPDWPRRLWTRFEPWWAWFNGNPVGVHRSAAFVRSGAGVSDTASPASAPWVRWGLSAYVVFHLLFPLRHLLYEGPTSWTERGHYFSWRMMLRSKRTSMGLVMTDVATRQSWIGPVQDYLNSEQLSKAAREPEMVLALAHFLAEEYHRQTGRTAEVRAVVLSALNGRKPQLLIDPTVNLAAEPLGFYPRPWILPLTEPLRDTPWDLPLDQWLSVVQIPEIPELSILKRGDGSDGRPGAAGAATHEESGVSTGGRAGATTKRSSPAPPESLSSGPFGTWSSGPVSGTPSSVVQWPGDQAQAAPARSPTGR